MAKTIKANGLDVILAQLADGQLRPGEFTVKQIHEQHKATGGTRSYHAIARMLHRLAEDGDMIRRPVVIDGSAAIAYSPK